MLLPQIYAVSAVLLLIGLIVFGIQLHEDHKAYNIAINAKDQLTTDKLVKEFLKRFGAYGDGNTMQSFLNFRTVSAVSS